MWNSLQSYCIYNASFGIELKLQFLQVKLAMDWKKASDYCGEIGGDLPTPTENEHPLMQVIFKEFRMLLFTFIAMELLFKRENNIGQRHMNLLHNLCKFISFTELTYFLSIMEDDYYLSDLIIITSFEKNSKVSSNYNIVFVCFRDA